MLPGVINTVGHDHVSLRYGRRPCSTEPLIHSDSVYKSWKVQIHQSDFGSNSLDSYEVGTAEVHFWYSHLTTGDRVNFYVKKIQVDDDILSIVGSFEGIVLLQTYLNRSNSRNQIHRLIIGCSNWSCKHGGAHQNWKNQNGKDWRIRKIKEKESKERKKEKETGERPWGIEPQDQKEKSKVGSKIKPLEYHPTLYFSNYIHLLDEGLQNSDCRIVTHVLLEDKFHYITVFWDKISRLINSSTWKHIRTRNMNNVESTSLAICLDKIIICPMIGATECFGEVRVDGSRSFSVALVYRTISNLAIPRSWTLFNGPASDLFSTLRKVDL